MKQGNAVFWQVAQGSNQFEITDAANGNSTKGNVLLRTNGHDNYDNKLILVPDGGSVGIDTPIPFTGEIEQKIYFPKSKIDKTVDFLINY